MDILEEIRKRKVFCDGGMGSLLQARGLKPGELRRHGMCCIRRF